jgi:hypothetical protein
MADKSFGVEEINLIGGSETPTIESPSDLNLNANTVAISTNLTIGGQINSDIIIGDYNVGIGTTIPTSAVDSNNTTILNVGIVTANYHYGDGSGLRNVVAIGTGIDIQNSGTPVGSAATINFGNNLTGSLDVGVYTINAADAPDVDTTRSIFSSFADYASHSETSNGSYNLVGIGSTYSEVGILTGSYASHNGDIFGISVAISADGNTIIVGAYDDNTPNNASDSGVVYVFDRVGTTFTEVGILTGTYASHADDEFGNSVACSADGNTIIVGARDDNIPDNADDSGVVYVFDRVGNDFNEVGILTGTYASDLNDNFGQSIACSADGNTIVVGSNNDEVVGSGNSSGVVYVFDRVGNDFNEVGILTGTYASDLNDHFGISVATSADGNTIVVGSNNDEVVGSGNSSGVVYVFDREYSVGIGTTFTQVGILTGTYASDLNDHFGRSVAISVDGNTIIVGAPGDETSGSDGYGLVYVFDREYSVGIGTTFTQVGILTGTYASDSSDIFGQSIACSADGNIIVVGAVGDEISGSNDYGVVYVFNRQGNNFNEVGILTGTHSLDTGDIFGLSIATSADGKHIIVGDAFSKIDGNANQSGVAYVFDQDTKETPLIRVGADNELFIDGNISIADTTSNAGGARYISTEAPSAGIGTEGDIWYDISATGDSAGTNGNIPIGGIIMWYGTIANIPASWRLCDGQSYSTAVGTIVTPDLRGQFIVGAADDTIEGTFSNNIGVGSTGGSKNAVLIAHSHTASTSAANAISGVLSGGAGGIHDHETGQNDAYDMVSNTVTIGIAGTDTAGNSSNTQTGTDANLPPYYALAYIMRIV